MLAGFCKAGMYLKIVVKKNFCDILSTKKKQASPQVIFTNDLKKIINAERMDLL